MIPDRQCNEDEIPLFEMRHKWFTAQATASESGNDKQTFGNNKQYFAKLDLEFKDMLVELNCTNTGVKRYYSRIVFHLINLCIVYA